jgi:transcription initiation factor TFIID subunit 2
MDSEAAPQALKPYTVLEQDVDLDFDFATRTLAGRTAIRIELRQREIRSVNLRCRQMEIKSVKIDNYVVSNYKFVDPYTKMTARDGFTVHQHHLINPGLERRVTGKDDIELRIPMPPRLKLVPGPTISLSLFRDGKSGAANPEASTPIDDGPRYKTFTVYVEYVIKEARDGIHWVGLEDGDMRFPQVYTYSNSLVHTQANYVFPCVDLPGTRHPWRFTITCPRTLGDIVPGRSTEETNDGTIPVEDSKANGAHNGTTNSDDPLSRQAELDPDQFLSTFSEVERSLDLSVVCSGDMEDSDVGIMLDTLTYF